MDNWSLSSDNDPCTQTSEAYYQDLEQVVTPEPETPSPKNTAKGSKKRSGSAIETSPSKRTMSNLSALSGDDVRLLQLKDEGVSYSNISVIFMNEGRGAVKPKSLSMRFSRLKANLIVWEEKEVEILQQAIAEVDKKKWEFVSEQMVKLGEGKIKKFSASACEKKSKELKPYNSQVAKGKSE